MPAGIPYIIGNEAAERFSFYGMRAILVVFMTKYLWLMDAQVGQAMSKPEATEYYHRFAAWVYFTPLFGALLSDIFLGKFRTIMSLSVLYCGGHAALACMGLTGDSSAWLFAGLVMICLGSGGIKPCVSAHVGDQFGENNQYLLSRIYNWFYFSINFGSFFSTLLTPWLLEWYGPHWAFGVPGVLMAIATLMFWLGRHRFIHVPASGMKFFREIASREGLIALAKLLPLYLFIALFWALYDQTGSSWVLQAEHLNLHFLGIDWLESQIQAINPILILLYIPLFTFFVVDRCRAATFGGMAVVGLRDHHGGGNHDIDRGTGVFLHAGAEEHEVAGDGVLSVGGVFGEHLHGGDQQVHSDSFIEPRAVQGIGGIAVARVDEGCEVCGVAWL
jgi:proton-dependent oligopeptide transporter, POT family